MANQQKTYTLSIDGNAALTLPALRADAKLLNAEIAKLPAGSAEAKAALQKLAQVKDEMGDLKEQINALNPDARLLGGFIALGQGIAGAFSVATVASQEFGLSGGAVEEYEKKVIGLLGVLSGLQSLKDALQPQNFAGLRALASGFDFAALRAKFFGTTTRAALTATGIGALLVAVGLLITYWDQIAEQGDRLKAKYADTFTSIEKYATQALAVLRTVLAVTTLGFSELAIKGVNKVRDALADTVTEARLAQAQLLAEQATTEQKLGDLAARAAGKRGAQLLAIQLQNAEAVEAASAEALAALQADQATRKKLSDADIKKLGEVKEAALNAAIKRREAAEALAAAEKKAVEEQIGDGERLALARTKQRTAAESAALAVQVRFAKERENSAQFELDGTQERQLAYEEAKTKRIELERQLTAALEAEYRKRLVDAEAIDLPKVKLEVAPPDFKAVIPAELPTVPVTVEPILSEVGFEEVLDLVQRGVAEASAIVNQITSDLTSTAAAQLDFQIQSLQDRIGVIDEQLSQTRSQLLSDEKQLQEATGARRAFLVEKIDKERAAEQRLAAEKKKAASEQKQAEQERQKLEKLAATITAATTVARGALLAVEAALAIVKASEKGKVGYDNIALALAATVALVSGFAAVKRAATLEQGGLLDGPRHSSGGIRGTGRFANIEVEGGEFVVNRRATAQNLSLLEMINAGSLPQYIPAPQGQTRYAIGGQLPEAATAGGSGSSDVVAELRALRADVQEVQRAVLIAPTRMPAPVLRIGDAAIDELSERQQALTADKNAATF